MSVETITDKRADLIAKIKALKAKTTENGCTVAEAMAASDAAARLMRKHQLEDDDLEGVNSERYGAIKRPVGTFTKAGHVRKHETTFLLARIARAYGVLEYGDGAEQVFFGEETAVRAAWYMVDLFREASESSLKTHIAGLGYRMQGYKTIRAEFMRGFVIESAHELDKQIAERQRIIDDLEYSNNKCTGVVRLRDAMMKSKWEQYCKDKGLQFVKVRRSVQSEKTPSYMAGARAAGNTLRGGAGGSLGGGARRIGE